MVCIERATSALIFPVTMDLGRRRVRTRQRPPWVETVEKYARALETSLYRLFYETILEAYHEDFPTANESDFIFRGEKKGFALNLDKLSRQAIAPLLNGL
jgi:hypothetical protein